MIEKSSIDNLLATIDIADVIENYISLRRVGASFVGKCPFHDDRKPSMSVSPARGFYHCFACGAGGNAVKFVMDYEKLSFVEAVEKLAKMYNFPLRYSENHEKIKFDKKILETLNIYYKSMLYKNNAALSYLAERGLNKGMMERWELGWAPSSQQTLNLLSNEEISPEDALKVGAIKSNENGLYASFIERITFPIYNHLGSLVGFGGRTISDNPAKYVNSPQSEIFDKSRVLFGYDKAKNEIYRKGEVIVCEGYMDCIMLHQAGFGNAVAVLGTALTEHHIPLLRRGEVKVVLSFDSDSAGQNAAFKSARLLALNEIDGRVVIISGGKDPAELIANGEIETLAKFYAGGVELGEFYITKLLESMPKNSPLEIAKALEAVQNFTFSLRPIVANAYSNLVANALNLDPASFTLSRGGGERGFRERLDALPATRPVIGGKRDILELSVLKAMLENPEFLALATDPKYGKDIFAHHSEIYSAVAGSQNTNNPHIRELEIYELNTLRGKDEFTRALNALKARLCERTIKTLAQSSDPSKFEKIRSLRALIQTLKEKP